MNSSTETYTVIDDKHVAYNGKTYTLYSGPKLEGERSVISLNSKRYPELLRCTHKPPQKLYVIGNVKALSKPSLAVIGARRATPYGLACTELFAMRAAEKGIVITSGGAFGCDSKSHRSALEAGGCTVAVLGGGCDQVYPQVNYRLFQDIIDSGGAVVSERPWHYPALPFTFRERNRIIAGLAQALLIVEAALPSGTFSTADAALNASRDVLVVPGSICSYNSAGSNQLLYQGATPVVDTETFEDVLFSVYGTLKQEDLKGPRKKEKRTDPLLDALQANPMRLDAIMSEIKVPRSISKDPEAWLEAQLVELEATGLIKRFPDGRYGPAKIAS